MTSHLQKEARHLYRTLLRQAAAIEDVVLCNHIVSRIRNGFAAGHRVVDERDAYDRVAKARRRVAMLQRILAGQPNELRRVLSDAYGVSGKRRHEIIRILLLEECEPARPFTPSRPETRPPTYPSIINLLADTQGVCIRMAQPIHNAHVIGREFPATRRKTFEWARFDKLIHSLKPPLAPLLLDRLQRGAAAGPAGRGMAAALQPLCKRDGAIYPTMVSPSRCHIRWQRAYAWLSGQVCVLEGLPGARRSRVFHYTAATAGPDFIYRDMIARNLSAKRRMGDGTEVGHKDEADVDMKVANIDKAGEDAMRAAAYGSLATQSAMAPSAYFAQRPRMSFLGRRQDPACPVWQKQIEWLMHVVTGTTDRSRVSRQYSRAAWQYGLSKHRYFSQPRRFYSQAHSSAIRIFVSESHDPLFNLAYEDYLHTHRAADEVMLFLYQNTPCVVIGRNQNPWRECNVPLLRREGIQLVRRLSGGGAVFHDMENTNFCVLTAREVFDRERHGIMIADELRSQYGLDVRMNTRHDLVMGREERKVSGSAFKIAKVGAYHHGTMLRQSDLANLGRYLRGELAAYIVKSGGVQSTRSVVANIGLTHTDFCNVVVQGMRRLYGVSAAETPIQIVSKRDEEVARRMQGTMDKLASDEWVYGATPAFGIDMRVGSICLGLEVKGGRIQHANVQSDDGGRRRHLENGLTGRILAPETFYACETQGPDEAEMVEKLSSMV